MTSLKRCLERLAADADRAGERIVITVHDNSGSPADEQRNRELCSTLDGRAARVVHCGETWRQALAEHLVARGIERPVVTFALWGTAQPRTGANRNAVLLSAAGSSIVMLDDDVLPRVWVPLETRAGITLTDAMDPRRFRFARTPDRLMNGLAERPDALWRAHAGLIGRSVASAAQRHGITALPGDWRSSESGWGDLIRAGKIRATLHGVVGDCGMGWLRRWLLLEGPSRDALVRYQRVYDASCASGFASRTSAGIQLSAAGNGAVGGFGIDATELVPPFLPSYRCSDAQFLIMLKRIHGNSVVAFLPEAIEHWPLDGQTRGRGAIWESTGLRFWDIVRAIVSRERVEEAGGSPSQRLVTSGRAIREAAAASAKDFRRMLLDIWRQHVSQWRTATEHALARHREEPAWWADDVRRLRGKLTADSARRHAGIPQEFGVRGGDAIPQLQRALASAGDLYEAWPAIWQCANTTLPELRSVRGF